MKTIRGAGAVALVDAAETNGDSRHEHHHHHHHQYDLRPRKKVLPPSSTHKSITSTQQPQPPLKGAKKHPSAGQPITPSTTTTTTNDHVPRPPQRQRCRRPKRRREVTPHPAHPSLNNKSKKRKISSDTSTTSGAGADITTQPHPTDNNDDPPPSEVEHATRQVGINHLPDPVLALVFAQLEASERVRIESVSRRWRAVAKNFSWTGQHSITKRTLCLSGGTELELWWMEKAKEEKQQVVQHRLDVLLNRSGRYLRELDLGRMGAFLNYNVCFVLKQTPQLTTLNLEGIQLTNSTLSLIGRILPQLQSVGLRNCFHSTQVERGLSAMLECCQQLRCLDVSDNSHFYGRLSLEHLPRSLQKLNISNCHELHSSAMAAIGERCAEALVELQMDQVDMVSPTDVNRLLERLRNLEALYYRYRFYQNTNANNGSGGPEKVPHLTGLGELRRLKRLSLSDNGLVTDATLKAVGWGCRALERLDISGCNRSVTDAGMRHLARLPSLTHLTMREMRHLTDETLQGIAKHGTLVELNLRRCAKVTDDSIVQVLEQCRQLQRLDVSHCPAVSNASLKKLREVLDDRYGKARPGRPDERFHLQTNHSGIKVTKDLRHPWLKVKDSSEDFMHMYLGHIVPFQMMMPPPLIHMAAHIFP